MDQSASFQTRRQRLETIRTQLENDRSSFLTHWREIGDYLLPRRPRFFITDVNRGERRSQRIIDTTASLALRTLRSGMMGGITSPARPWFRLTTPDPDLADISSVKEWLFVVGQRMSTVFLKSNLYQTLPIMYGDLGAFAISAMVIEEDFENVIRCTALPIGSYLVANNKRGKVDVIYRDFRMTVRQLIEEFGFDGENKNEIDWSRFSTTVRNLWNTNQSEQWIDVCHVIRPNEEYDPNKIDSRFKKYVSIYYERGNQATATSYDGNETFLRVKGYDYFPVICPRWEVTGEDVYGTECPGMLALGDIKQLQLMERRGAQAIEKMINPPMVGPTSLKTASPNILPGGITYSDEREGQKGFRAAHEVNFRLDALENKEDRIRARIKSAFYEDLFLMMANDDRSDITATEIAERKEEKLLALGPVLEQLNQDGLDPLIDITFAMMARQGLIPPPPQEIQGMPLRIEYISVMAQAQKIVGISGIERFMSFTGQIAAQHPEIADKIDIDHVVDTYADMTSIPPGIVRSDDEVQQIRAQRQKAQQAQAMAQSIQQGAQAAKNLSQADTSGQNALTDLMDQANAGNLVGGP